MLDQELSITVAGEQNARAYRTILFDKYRTERTSKTESGTVTRLVIDHTDQSAKESDRHLIQLVTEYKDGDKVGSIVINLTVLAPKFASTTYLENEVKAVLTFIPTQLVRILGYES